ncbi:MAG TPA: hypothetical protein VK674_07155 [Candidatus Limnocylindria bacterium]|nr:hypothetical protein [Candidatus Limnocylindria bacterium]
MVRTLYCTGRKKKNARQKLYILQRSETEYTPTQTLMQAAIFIFRGGGA